MEQKKFEAMLVLIVPQVINLILENTSVAEVTSTERFYCSKVYAMLEQEETKLWHLSPLTLYNMYEEEEKNGTFEIPEEV